MIKLPAIGQGIGNYHWDETHLKVLRKGIELGLNFIDTAEGYDNGHAEEIVGKAIKGIRKKVIIGTKFSPEHNSYEGVRKAVEGSLRRLNTDYIDLYQMHWPNPKVPLVDTIFAMKRLIKQGKIRYIGLGNVYLKSLEQTRLLLNSKDIVSLQIEYNLFDRLIEDEIIPFCEENKIMIIAYAPLDYGRIADSKKGGEALKRFAKKYNKTVAQIALRWLINKPSVVVLPKTMSMDHIEENAASADFDIEGDDIAKISDIFKRPYRYISPDKIYISPHGERNKLIYQTLEEAKENRLNHTPSPLDLAECIKKEHFIKPVRLIPSTERDRKYDYDLVEGRLRYWAWVIAFGSEPIPAYIREK